MKGIGWAVASLTLLLPLAGCGSSDTPPFSVACTVHRMSSGAIQAAVTVTNSTSTAATAFVYGPALSWLQYIHPVLEQTQVVVTVGHSRPVSYFGRIVPHVQPDKPAHLNLQFRPPPRAQSIVVSTSASVHAGDASVITNADCSIKR